MKKRVIAFVGMPGSGKGTCSNYLSEKYGFPIIHFGNMVYEEVQRRHLDNIKDEVFVREDMRKQEGPAVLAIHATKKANEYFDAGTKTVLLDGLYSWSEYKYLEKAFGDSLTVIAIVANKKDRRQRVLDRQDTHRAYTLEQLITREITEIEHIEKGGPIAYADYTLCNDASLEQLLLELDQLVKKL